MDAPQDLFQVVLLDWQFLSVLVLLGIFALILVCYVMAFYFGKVEEARFTAANELDSNALGQNLLEGTTLGQNVLDPSLTIVRGRIDRLSRVATRAYVAMVLVCAAFYIGPSFLGLRTAIWYSLVLYGFPLVSAFFVYRVWSKVREE